MRSSNDRDIPNAPFSILALLTLAFGLIFFASGGLGMRAITPKVNLSSYNPVEAQGIVTYLDQAETADQCARIVMRYHILSEKDFDSLSNVSNLPELKARLIEIVEDNVLDGLMSFCTFRPQKIYAPSAFISPEDLPSDT